MTFVEMAFSQHLCVFLLPPLTSDCLAFFPFPRPSLPLVAFQSAPPYRISPLRNNRLIQIGSFTNNTPFLSFPKRLFSTDSYLNLSLLLLLFFVTPLNDFSSSQYPYFEMVFSRDFPFSPKVCVGSPISRKFSFSPPPLLPVVS